MNGARPLLLFLLAAACQDTTDVVAPERTGPPVVRVSIPPMGYLVQRLVGEAAIVEVALPDGSDPVLWRPRAEGVIAFQEADLVVLNGARLERWADAVSLPDNRVVRAANGFREQWITFEKEVRHRHGPEGEHSHKGVNPYTWIDPVLAGRQAEAIRAALARTLPADKLTEPARVLAGQFAKLDERLRALPKGRLQSDQPALAYLAQRYGWTVAEDGVPVDLDLGLARGADLLAAMQANLERLTAALGR
ncbi:MAG: metal ABC transporter substrate-binding protein [Planctomycetota bacterium]